MCGRRVAPGYLPTCSALGNPSVAFPVAATLSTVGGGGGSYSQGLLFPWTGRNFRLPRGKNIEEKAPPSALLGLGVGYLTWEKRTALSARYLSLPVLQKDACGPVSSGCDWGGLCFGKGEVYGFGWEEFNLWGTLRKPTPSRVLFIIPLKLWQNRSLSDPRASASALSSLKGPSHCSEFPSCVQLLASFLVSPPNFANPSILTSP